MQGAKRREYREYSQVLRRRSLGWIGSQKSGVIVVRALSGAIEACAALADGVAVASAAGAEAAGAARAMRAYAARAPLDAAVGIFVAGVAHAR